MDTNIDPKKPDDVTASFGEFCLWTFIAIGLSVLAADVILSVVAWVAVRVLI